MSVHVIDTRDKKEFGSPIALSCAALSPSGGGNCEAVAKLAKGYAHKRAEQEFDVKRHQGPHPAKFMLGTIKANASIEQSLIAEQPRQKPAYASSRQ